MQTFFIDKTIRPATLYDIERIYALEQTCNPNPWTREGVAEEFSNPNSIFLVLETQAPHATSSQIIGFISAALILDEIHILEVAVCPNHRNAGLGSLLINALLSSAAAKNAVRACLEVRAANLPAIRVYEKRGFGRDGVRKGYYQDGEDAVLMSLELF
ncbi:MAG: ribosomal protein S18-alanine N-acetyltransferase [Chitinispirillales bacterium]|jgi:ribosomal-protein-alanine N-acetyltransferase|nr:ribosomal protein S18-alanine N-acetyltransferase [Chitinispirillales bacterium]